MQSKINVALILILFFNIFSCTLNDESKRLDLGNVVNDGFTGDIYLRGAKCFDKDSLNTILEKSTYYNHEDKKFVFDNKQEKLYFLFSVRNEKPCSCAISLISYLKDGNGDFHSVMDQGKAIDYHDILAEEVLPKILSLADSAKVYDCDTSYFYNF